MQGNWFKFIGEFAYLFRCHALSVMTIDDSVIKYNGAMEFISKWFGEKT